ncbi:MAG TPA: hypothetical protein VIL69_06015 [Roseomonas sp.]
MIRASHAPADDPVSRVQVAVSRGERERVWQRCHRHLHEARCRWGLAAT